VTYERIAVIPTHNRPAELRVCVDAIINQVDFVIVIDNASDPPVSSDLPVAIIRDPQQPPNLSRLWNLGLSAAQAWGGPPDAWDVAILNDDAIPYPGWMDLVCASLREGAAAACVMPHGSTRVLGPSDPPGVGNRVSGWAFALRGELRPRFDETFQWWCGDDDISMWAKQNGGLAIIHGNEVPNTQANGWTSGELLARTALDMQAFVDKHGMRPW
jgi:glycosyltransferase involved in cell wall biosynthesis